MKPAYVSHDCAVRLARAREWFDEQVASDPMRGVVVVAPTRRSADDFVRTHPSRGLIGVHRSSPAQLAATLALGPLAAAGQTRTGALGIEAVVHRAIANVHSELATLRDVAQFPGFARALTRTLGDLRAQGWSAQRLAEVEGPRPDLARLMAEFEATLQTEGFADASIIYETAAAVIAAPSNTPIAGLPVLLLDVVPQTKLEREFLGALVAHCPSACATMHEVDEAAARLDFNEVFAVQRCESAPSQLQQMRAGLFSPDDRTPPVDDGSFSFFSSPGEARECLEIARRVLETAESGVPFDRVAVLLRDPDRYQAVLSDAFIRAQVPAFFTRGAKRPDPSGRALLSLLACASEGLSASRFAEYLSLGQVPELDAGAPPIRAVAWRPPRDELQLVFMTEESSKPDSIGASPAFPDKWEALLVDAAVVGGQERWRRRLSGLRAELELQQAFLEREGDLRAQARRRDVDNLDALSRFALPIIDELATFESPVRWGEWIARLRRLAGASLRDPDAVSALLGELEPMAAVGPVSLQEVRDVLEDRLRFLREPSADHRFGAVFVGTMEEALGRSFSVVFLPGLAEGIFPKRIREDPLLLDAVRGVVDPELATRAKAVKEEAHWLARSLGAAEQKLVASYPRIDLTRGRARVPSLLGLELLRAAGGQLPSLGALQSSASEGSDARLGWPAPRAATDAIDDAEYDLAALAAAMPLGAKAKGLGRYLLDARDGRPNNEFLRRSLTAQFVRWRPAWSRYDGLMAQAEGTKQLLAKHRLGKKAQSPTALQNYAACPYRFALYALLRLRPRDEFVVIEQLDPLTRGSMFHDIQFRLFTAFDKADLLPVVPENIETALALLDTVAADAFARYESDLAPAIATVWRRETEAMRVELRRWLRDVVERDPSWKPIHAELAFGLDPLFDDARDDASRRRSIKILDKYKVRGAIDLVERNEGSNLVRITDHKTGRAPKQRPTTVGRGEALQPLIYALAVDAMLPDDEVQSGRLYYCTPRGGYSIIEVDLSETTKKQLGEVLETVDQSIKDGGLPAAPRKDACRWCDYRIVCGPGEEKRTAQKSTTWLKGLLEMRNLR